MQAHVSHRALANAGTTGLELGRNMRDSVAVADVDLGTHPFGEFLVCNLSARCGLNDDIAAADTAIL